MKNRKVEGISRRVKVKKENWYLWVKGEMVLILPTKTKRERNILSAIRKMLIAYKITDFTLTNRERYIKNVNVSQEQLKRMKANDKWVERGHLQNE
jgi:CRISPR/Cas system-associated protein endoribonuclease Cas2